MKRFSDFGIKPAAQGFTGDKIRIDRILNKPIKVHDYRVENSKFKDKGLCLHMQIEVDDAKRVVFTGSAVLIQMIEQVPKSEMPFTTTIIKDNDRFEFT